MTEVEFSRQWAFGFAICAGVIALFLIVALALCIDAARHDRAVAGEDANEERYL